MLKWVACAAILASSLSLLSAAPGGRKYLVLLADYGKEGPGPAIVETLQKNPELRLVIPWPSTLKPSEGLKALVTARRVEAALRLEQEPVLPLIADTQISSPLEIHFSWPEDVWDVIVRSQVEANQNTVPLGKGICLRSGMLSQSLVPGLRKLGLRWANYTDPNGGTGICLDNSMLLLAARPAPAASAAECLAWVTSRQEPVVILTPAAGKTFSAAFLTELAAQLRQNRGVRLTTADQLLREAQAKPNFAPSGSVPDPDMRAWLASPIVWYQLDSVRRAIEDYKNSGQAKLRVLQQLRDELYGLYDYEFLLRLAQNPVPEDEKRFQTGIAAIYRTLNRPMDLVPEISTTTAADIPYSLEATTSSLHIVNAAPADSAVITDFAVTLDPDAVRYRVAFSTSAGRPECVDVYMDLNNQEGAGITRLLPGSDALMETNDAWEFALRFENGQVSLYRSGRFEPTLVRTFAAADPYEAVIPRQVLRGNPVQWGYQAVALKKNGTGGLKIYDFISQEYAARKKILDQIPVQLPAVKSGGSRTRIE